MPNPPYISFLNDVVNGLELHPSLKTVLLHSLEGRRPPKGLFDAVSYRYFVTYVMPKIASVLRNKPVMFRSKRELYYTIIRFFKKSILTVYISPSYLLYDFEDLITKCYHKLYGFYEGKDYTKTECFEDSRPRYYYMLGVDDDGEVFVNRVNGAPDLYERRLQVTENVEFRWVSDGVMRGVMGYAIDLGDREEVVIDVTPDPSVNVRVQGDIVLAIEPMNESVIKNRLGFANVVAHSRRLLTDIVNRILLDHGITCSVSSDSNMIIDGIAPKKKVEQYLDKIFRLVARELGELLGAIEIEEGERDVDNLVYVGSRRVIIKDGDFKGFSIAFVARRWRRNDPFASIELLVTQNSDEDNPLVSMLWNELLSAFENMAPVSMEFSIGNHHVKINNAKPLSFMFRPSRQPVTLNENIITVRNPSMFIVTPDTTIELYHKEHGIKTIRFKNNYIISFRDVDTNFEYIFERNRVVIESLEL